LASFSYVSNGKTLDATLWLDKLASSSNAVNNSRIIFPAAYRIDIFSAKNSTLKNSLNDLLAFFKKNMKDFNLDTNESITVDGNPAFKLIFTFTGEGSTSCKHCKVMQVLTNNDGKLYSISYLADIQKYPEYVRTVENITNSTEIFQGQARSPANEYHESGHYRLRIHNLYNWTLTTNPNPYPSNYTHIFTYTPSGDVSDKFRGNIEMLINNSPRLERYPLNKSEYVDSVTQNYASILAHFRLLEPDTQGTTEDNLKYSLVYTYSLNPTTTIKVKEKGWSVGDDRVFVVRYSAADNPEFGHFSQQAENMIDSLENNIQMVKWPNIPGLNVHYPYNWAHREATDSFFGYKNSSHMSGVVFYPTPKGIYTFYREYRMDITYDSLPSGRLAPKNTAPPVYTVRIDRDWERPNWNKTIEERSVDNVVRILGNSSTVRIPLSIARRSVLYNI